MKGIFDEYISEPIDSQYREIKEYNGVLTRREALFDLDELCYILNNRYSGKEYWERQGISFDKCYSDIKADIERMPEINIGDFCRFIHHAFDRGIVDAHLSFASPLTGRLHYAKKYAAYFADIIVERTGGRYLIVKSTDQNAKVGAAVHDIQHLYPTLAPAGKEYFLIGCRSWDPCKSIHVRINGTIAELKLHRCRAGTKRETGDVCLKESSVNGIPAVRSNCCDYVPPLNRDNDVLALGKKYSDSGRMIWNNLSNEGGYSRIPEGFVLGLNGYVACEEYCAKLISPITEKKNCRREWILTNSAEYDREKGTYDGTLYFLMNSDTASAGESSVLFAKSLRSVVFIGENSMGCNTFGNVASYQLTNSSMILRVPNMINLCKNPEDCVEGKGFTPDFWVDHPDVQEETVRWLSNPRTFMPNLAD
ncbi:MAG: S41 family peptidase [Clostridiaceae bacterium]|nr:S41 family peptidase [Clostridiaceae bacterium]